jgi:manganese/zinc/iron transport system permease protein
MTRSELEVQILAALVAVACALPGVFLVLRRLALISDAISHTILLGIVAVVLLTGNLMSPWVLVGATLTGVVTVSLVELLNRTQLLREDAAIGLVYPLLFSIGVILVAQYGASIHLDIDAVLLGQISQAPLRRVELFYPLDQLPWFSRGVPYSLLVMAAIASINIVFIAVFYKELKLSTFDAALATSLGFSPVLLHYALMTLVSVTIVGAFDAVGAALVVAFIIVPPATAYLLTDRLSRMLVLSGVIGVTCAISGYWIGYAAKASPIGAMTGMMGAAFAAALLFGPERGVIVGMRRRAQQRWEFAETMLAIHLFNHEGTPRAETESRAAHLQEHLRWQPDFAARVIERGEREGLFVEHNGRLSLTERGRVRAREALSV